METKKDKICLLTQKLQKHAGRIDTQTLNGNLTDDSPLFRKDECETYQNLHTEKTDRQPFRQTEKETQTKTETYTKTRTNRQTDGRIDIVTESMILTK